MSSVSDPSDTPTSPPRPGPMPGERRLDRPPSDRYRATEPSVEASAPAGSTGRAAIGGLVVALLGAIATVILGGVLTVSAGLLVVAAAAGWAIGTATRLGGGRPTPAGTRAAIAIGAAGVGVILGQLGLWWYAGLEGGVLGPVDYLAQTFGVLVPLQSALTLGLAWWTAR